ncbi:MAG: hypothetical protein FK733_09205 [Asgard group archaeon]|nr:hypothetical protein [Asgard group archaeon]
MTVNFIMLVPILVPFIVAILLFGLKKWISNFAGEIATGAIIINIAILAAISFRVQQASTKILYGFYNATTGAEYSSPMGVQLRIDGFSSWFLIFVNIVVALLFAYEASKQRNRPDGAIYLGLLLILTAGANAVLIADDFLTLFLAWVIIGVSLIILVSYKRTIKALREGGIKAYILIGLALIFQLIAVILSYGLFGSLSFEYVKDNFALLFLSRIQDAQAVLYLIISFVIVGFGLFANVFLLNIWMPKATENAPASTQTFAFGIISGLSILSLIRVLYSLFDPGIFTSINYPLILVIIGIITAFEGVLLLFYQVIRKDKENISLTKVITFVSIVNIGLVITGISIGGIVSSTTIDSFLTANDCLGYSALQLINLAISSYLCYTSKERAMLMRDSDKLHDLRGLGRELPLTSFILVISLTSLVGILPTFGGVNLYMLVFSLFQLEQSIYAIIIIIVIILLLVSYLLVIKYLLFDKPGRGVSFSSSAMLDDLTLPNFFGLVIAIGLLILGFIPNLIANPIIENAGFIIP